MITDEEFKKPRLDFNMRGSRRHFKSTVPKKIINETQVFDHS